MDSSDELKRDAYCGDLSNETEADLLEDVYHYITKKQYREGLTQNQKRIIRKKITIFYVVDGEMMYKKKLIGNNEVCLIGIIIAYAYSCFKYAGAGCKIH